MGVRVKVLVGLLALGLVVVSLPRMVSHADSAAAVVELTDVPGKWFDPAVVSVLDWGELSRWSDVNQRVVVVFGMCGHKRSAASDLDVGG